MPVPVVVVASGGVPIVNTTRGAPMTPVNGTTIQGLPVTLVTEGAILGGMPVALVNDDLSVWEPE